MPWFRHVSSSKATHSKGSLLRTVYQTKADHLMQHIKQGYRGLGVLVNVNADLLLYVTTLVIAFACAGFVAAL